MMSVVSLQSDEKSRLFSIPPNASMLEAALAYASVGWAVFPVHPKNKRPYPGSRGFYDATTAPEQIHRWWWRNDISMIALATGSRSDVFAVDLDRKPGKADGVATWAKLKAERGAPDTLSSVTPSSGEHHFYRNVEGLRCVALDTIAPGIEIKADGGYVVLAPSFCTAIKDIAGVAYRWNEPLIAPAEPPDWLVAEILRHSSHYEQPVEPPSDDVSPERIIAALNAIDPDLDRKSWIAIGCALFKQLGDEEGFKLWNEWSSRGQKYKPHEMSGQWMGIKKRAGYAYSIGTLFFYANESDSEWWRGL
jgi:hypothetical protein